MRAFSSAPHHRPINERHNERVSRWKVLAATPFLLIPLAVAGISVGDGIEHRESRPTVVLPSLTQGPQVTMRPLSPGKAEPGKGDAGKGDPGKGDPDADPGGPSPDRPGPDRQGPPREAELTCTHDDDDDDDQDDEVEVVTPCPDAVDDDDDDDGDDDGDDADGDD